MLSSKFAILRYMLFCLVIPRILLLWSANNDFDLGKKAYTQGKYKIAQIYFENFLQEDKFEVYIPDAAYYLIKICEKTGAFTNLISYADLFLARHKYDLRCPEIFNLLLEQLIEKEAFAFAFDYIKRYDYFEPPLPILEKIGYGLLQQNRLEMADYVFSSCPQTDTIKIVRAAAAIDNTEKKQYYKSIGGVKGKLYLIEHYLEIGDTIEAYVVYKFINGSEVPDTELYRYSKVSRLFDEDEFSRTIKQLVKLKGFFNKSHLLNALNTGHYRLADGIYHRAKKIPFDQEECVLLAEYVFQDTISRKPPDFIHDSLSEDQILLLREETKSYFLDSLYAEKLIGRGEMRKALTVILPYIFYSNTKDFVRMVRGQYYYEMKEYETAVNEIILSRSRDPGVLFILADALKNLDRKYDFLLVEILNTSKDSVLLHRSVRELIIVHFANGEYDDVANYEFEVVQGDTTLMKIFLYSLARTGRREDADSIFNQFFIGPDYELINYYGEYLIDKKKYQKARSYYDSIIHTADTNLSEGILYNWALVPFMQAEIDTALERFNFYINKFKDAKSCCSAFFKVATINYIQENYDTAGYFYGLASRDSSLRFDGLQNQLICYKKTGDWNRVIEVGKKIIPLVSEGNESEVRFELGYAYLRAAEIKKSIENLKTAVRLNPTPEYYYWLAEAYFSRGEMMKALYHYQKIVDLFPKDEMWFPTAQYKSGVAFEYLNEFEEARKVYKAMIRNRGVGDIWGAEAQKRLEEIE